MRRQWEEILAYEDAVRLHAEAQAMCACFVREEAAFLRALQEDAISRGIVLPADASFSREGSRNE